MFRNTALVIVSVLYNISIFAQVVITSDDSPVPGDTIRKSLTTVLDGIDYQPGGPGQNWQFDELTVISQQVDTFISVDNTPSIYQLFFNNNWIYPDYNADVAQKLTTFNAIPGLTLTDSYSFIKYQDNQYREVGYGVTLEGVQIPIQMQNIDTIYRYPLEYGDIDSAHSLLEVQIPDVGYLMVAKFRRNTVDGWGTLSTPYGQFETLRMRTEITEYDSVYSDSLGFGMPITRNIVEYKWMAPGFHEPLLVISEDDFLVNASYIDSVRSNFLTIPEPKKNRFDFNIYPNPCENYFSAEYELASDADVVLSIYSVYGSELKKLSAGHQEQGYFNRKIYLDELGIPSGVYIVRLKVDNVSYTRKLIVR